MIKVQLDESHTLAIAEALLLSERKYEKTKNNSDSFNAVYRRVKFLHDLFSDLDISPVPYEITISASRKQEGDNNGK